MKRLLITLIALTCATAFAQSVSLPGVGADVWGVGGDVKGRAIYAAILNGTAAYGLNFPNAEGALTNNDGNIASSTNVMGNGGSTGHIYVSNFVSSAFSIASQHSKITGIVCTYVAKYNPTNAIGNGELIWIFLKDETSDQKLYRMGAGATFKTNSVGGIGDLWGLTNQIFVSDLGSNSYLGFYGSAGDSGATNINIDGLTLTVYYEP